MTAQREQIIFDGDHVQVIYVPQGSRVCFVTFTSLGGGEGFGRRFLASRGISAIHFISKWDHWWQPPEIRTAALRASLLLCSEAFDTIVTYGASMGAYGAAAYSWLSHANLAILIAPQYSIDPDKPPYENRWVREASRIDFKFDCLQNQISRKTQYYILYDPRSIDTKHTDLFLKTGYAVSVPVPFGGHTCGHVLQHAGLLESLILDIVHETFDSGKFLRLLHSRKRASPIYWFVLGQQAQKSGRNALAVYCFAEAHRLDPVSYRWPIEAANAYWHQGDGDQALAWSQKAIRAAPTQPRPRFHLAGLYMQMKRYDAARQAVIEALTVCPGNRELLERLEVIGRLERVEAAV